MMSVSCVDNEFHLFESVTPNVVLTVAEYKMTVVFHLHKGSLEVTVGISIGIETVKTVEP